MKSNRSTLSRLAGDDSANIQLVIGLMATVLVGIFLLPIVAKQGDIVKGNTSLINLGLGDLGVVLVVIFAIGVVVVAIRSIGLGG